MYILEEANEQLYGLDSGDLGEARFLLRWDDDDDDDDDDEEPEDEEEEEEPEGEDEDEYDDE